MDAQIPELAKALPVRILYAQTKFIGCYQMDRLVHDLPDLFEEMISIPPREYIIKMYLRVAVTMYLVGLMKQLKM